MKNTDEFSAFISSFLGTYRHFCADRAIEVELSKIAKTGGTIGNITFWNTVRIALKKEFTLELAKIFEKGRDSNVLSIYYLLDFQFEEYKETISKLKKMRDKFLAHNDIKTQLEIDKFFKELNLSFADHVEPLFLKIIEVLEDIEIKNGLPKGTRVFANNIRTHIEEEVHRIMNKLRVLK